MHLQLFPFRIAWQMPAIGAYTLHTAGIIFSTGRTVHDCRPVIQHPIHSIIASCFCLSNIVTVIIKYIIAGIRPGSIRYVTHSGDVCKIFSHPDLVTDAYPFICMAIPVIRDYTFCKFNLIAIRCSLRICCIGSYIILCEGYKVIHRADVYSPGIHRTQTFF